ncbi:MAG: hypothetical protein BYD32DRAFT_405422 [Podila humilis]|nr:MAG: hypothetical protein BYD32DRAFT_405422 [Podila humilis]
MTSLLRLYYCHCLWSLSSRVFFSLFRMHAYTQYTVALPFDLWSLASSFIIGTTLLVLVCFSNRERMLGPFTPLFVQGLEFTRFVVIV